MSYNLTPEVQQIGQLNLQGNIIPHSWYQHIKFENGKTDSISVLILAEIVYWYRPRITRDEQTGSVVHVSKRFEADLLQRTKKSFAEQFGFTERQVQESLARLESLGLIKRVLRTIHTKTATMGNVLFIQIFPERIKQISFHECKTYDVKTSEGIHSNVDPMTFKRQTYTENTTKTTTEKNSSTPAKADAKKLSSLIKRKEQVQVSEEHHQKLISKYGKELTEKAYEFLNEWKSSKAETDPKALKTHTDYYRITKWVMKEVQEQQSKPGIVASTAEDVEEAERIRQNIIKFITKNHAHIRNKGIYIDDRVTHVVIVNDSIYYKDKKAVDLIKNSLSKHGLN